MGRLKRLLADRRGISAIEFALVAPVMVFAYLGVAELCSGMLAQNRTQHIAATVGDLVAQASTPTLSDVNDDFAAAAAIMAPLSTSSLKMRVSSVVADANGKTTIGWSEGYGGMTTLAQGAAIEVTPIVVPANGSVIQAVAQYTYVSPLPIISQAGWTFNQVFYLSPRQTTVIPPPT